MDALFRITHRISENGNIIGYHLVNLCDGSEFDEMRGSVWARAKSGQIENVKAAGSNMYQTLSGINGFELKSLPVIKRDRNISNIGEQLELAGFLFAESTIQKKIENKAFCLGYAIKNNSNMDLVVSRINIKGEADGEIILRPQTVAYLNKREAAGLLRSYNINGNISNGKLESPRVKPGQLERPYIVTRGDFPRDIIIEQVVSPDVLNRYFYTTKNNTENKISEHKESNKQIKDLSNTNTIKGMMGLFKR